jgi:hypothetical protein
MVLERIKRICDWRGSNRYVIGEIPNEYVVGGWDGLEGRIIC